MEQKGENKSGGRVTLIDRKELYLTGVTDILSFDENNLYLQTALGALNIDGEELHVGELSLEKGELTLTGRISGLFYENEQVKKSGLFGKKSSVRR